MRIVLLDGTPGGADSSLQSFLAGLTGPLTAGGHQATALRLGSIRIQRCTGCWGCWVKTPGRCVIADEMERVLEAAINCELLVFASPLLMGMTSALLKRATDRLLPLLSPSIRIVDGACRHAGRYESYPRLALLVEPERDTDGEDLEIVEGIYRELAIDFKSKLVFTGTTDLSAEEVADALGDL